MLSTKDVDSEGDVSLEEYNRKFASMQKYIPFLLRMMDHLKDNQEKQAQLEKIKSLYNIVTNTKKRLKYDTLKKCEDGLKNLYHKIEKVNFFPNSPVTSLVKDVNVPIRRKSETKSTPASPSPPSSPAPCFPQKPILIPTERKMSPMSYEKLKARTDIDHRFKPPPKADEELMAFQGEIKPKLSKPSLITPRPVDPPLSKKDLENLFSDSPPAALNTEEKELDELEQLRIKLVQEIEQQDQDDSNSTDKSEKNRNPKKEIKIFGDCDIDERVRTYDKSVSKHIPETKKIQLEPSNFNSHNEPISPDSFSSDSMELPMPKLTEENKFVRLADKYQRKPRSISTDNEVDISVHITEYIPTGRGLTSRELERFGASGNLPPVLHSPTPPAHENRPPENRLFDSWSYENRSHENRSQWNSPMEWNSSPISPPIKPPFASPPRMTSSQGLASGYNSPYNTYEQRCPPVPSTDQMNDPYNCYRNVNRNFQPPDPYKASTNNDFINRNRKMPILMPQNQSPMHSNFIRPSYNEGQRSPGFNKFQQNNVYNATIGPTVAPRPSYGTNLITISSSIPPLPAPPLPPAGLLRMDYRTSTKNSNDFRQLTEVKLALSTPYRAKPPSAQQPLPSHSISENLRPIARDIKVETSRDPRRRNLDDVSDNDPRKHSFEKRVQKPDKKFGGYDPRTIPKKPPTSSGKVVESVSSTKTTSLQNFKIPKIKKSEPDPVPEEEKIVEVEPPPPVVTLLKTEPKTKTSDSTQNPEISSNTDESINETRSTVKVDEKEAVINNFLQNIVKAGEVGTIISALGKLGETLSVKKMKRLQQLLKSDSDSEDEGEEIKDKSKDKTKAKTSSKVAEESDEGKDVEEPVVVASTSKKPKPRSKKTEVVEIEEEKKKPKRRSDLEMLQDDIRDMFICKGVLTATGHRMCRILKENQDTVKTTPENSPSETSKKKSKSVTPEEILPLLPKTRLRRSSSISSSISSSSTESSNRRPSRVPRVLLDKTDMTKINVEPEPVISKPLPRTRKRNTTPAKVAKTLEKPKENLEKPTENLEKSKENSEKPKKVLSKSKELVEESKEVLEKPKDILNKSKEIVEEAKTILEPSPEILDKRIESLLYRTFLNRNKKILPQIRTTKRIILKAKLVDVTKRLHKTVPQGELNSLFPSDSVADDEEALKTERNLREKKKKINYSENNEKVDQLISKLEKKNDVVEKMELETEVVPEVKTAEEKDIHDKSYFYEGHKKYSCQLCPFFGKMIVHHYKVSHDEVLISRLAQENADRVIKESIERDYANMELEEFVTIENRRKRFSSFCCIFCNFTIEFDFTEIFYDHISSHTGEDRFRCQKCSFTTTTRSALRAHYSYNHPKVKVTVADESYCIYPACRNVAIIFGYLCSECNYVQIHRKNLEKHVEKYHPGKDVAVYTINMSSVKTVVADKKVSKVVIEEVPVEKEKVYSLREKTLVVEPPKDVEPVKTVEPIPEITSAVQDACKTDVKDPIETKEDIEEEVPTKKSSEVNFLAFVCEEPTENVPVETNVEEFLTAAEKIPTDMLDYSKSKFESFLEALNTKLYTPDSPSDAEPSALAIPEVNHLEVGASSQHSAVLEHISEDLKKIKNHVEPIKEMCRPVEDGGKLNDKQLMKDDALIPQDVYSIFQNIRSFEQQKNNIDSTIDKLVTVMKKDPDTIVSEVSSESDGIEDDFRDFFNKVDNLQSQQSSESEISEVVLIDFGLFGVKEVDGKLVYFCSNLTSCTYETNVESDFSKHIDNKHKMDCWDGECLECKINIHNNGKKRTIRDAYNHFVAVHLNKLSPNVDKNPNNEKFIEKVIQGFIGSPVEELIAAREELDKSPSILPSVLVPAKLCHLYKCMMVTCDFSTDIRVDFINHILNKNKKTIQQNRCPYCIITTIKSVHGLAEHIMQQHSNCVYQCGCCFYRCVSPVAIKMHGTLRHKNQNPNPPIIDLDKPMQHHTNKITQADGTDRQLPLDFVCRPYKCVDCPSQETSNDDSNTIFYVTEEFSDHLHKCHEKETLTCSVCNAGFSDATVLIEHYVEHGIGEIQCLYCQSGMLTERIVNVHMAKYHTNHPHIVLYRQISPNFINVATPVNSVHQLYLLAIRNLDMLQENPSLLQRLEEVAEEQSASQSGATNDENGLILLDNTNDSSNSMSSNSSKMNMSLNIVDVDNSAFADLSKLVSDDVQIPELDSTNIDVTDESQNESLLGSQQNNESLNNGEDFEVSSGNEEALEAKYMLDDMPMEELLKKGLYGSDLYRCGSNNCEFLCDNQAEFKSHTQKCPHTKSGVYKCFHCKKIVRHLNSILDHLTSHSIPKYRCGVCNYRAPFVSYIFKHLKGKHKAPASKVFQVNRDNIPVDLFVVVPRNKKPPTEPTKKTPKTPDKTMTIISNENELKALPNQPILFFDIKCAKCTFTTRIKHNMSRHLNHHSMSNFVPEVGPVNPVPCLGKSEKMFDKMVNLACSSNPSAYIEKNKEKTKKAVPEFVPENKRFVCGANHCNYLSVDETMLRYHFKTLHSDETFYKCPHCTESSIEHHNAINIDKIINHLKMHDSKLYRCAHCSHYHYLKYIIEKHLVDKHPAKPPYVEVIRELDPVQAETGGEISKPSTSDASHDNKPWKCGICTYSTLTRNDILEHAKNIHDIKSQFKCKLCPFKCSYDKNFDRHFASKHPGLQVQMIHVYYHEGGIQEQVDNSPIWRRDEFRLRHIRGILVDETEPAEGTYDNLDETHVIPPSAVKSPGKKKGPRPKVANSNETGSTVFYNCTECKEYVTPSIKEFAAHMCKEFQYERFKCFLCSSLYWDLDWAKHHFETEHDTPWDPKFICLSHIYDEQIEKSIVQMIIKQRGNVGVSHKLNDLSDVFPNNLLMPAIENVGVVTQENIVELDPSEIVNRMDSSDIYDPRQIDKNTCPHCNYKSKYPRDVMKHVFRHWALQPFQCGICNVKAYRAIDAFRHSSATHPNQRSRIFQLCPLKDIPIKPLLKRPGGPANETEQKVQKLESTRDSDVVRNLDLNISEHLGDQSNLSSSDVGDLVIDESETSIDSTISLPVGDSEPISDPVQSETVPDKEEADIYLCQYCPKRGVSVDEIHEHWSLIHKNTRVAMSQFKYRTFKLNQVPARGRVMCLYCGLRGSKMSIRVHQRKYHSGKKDKTKIVSSVRPNVRLNCKDCDFFVYNTGLLRLHYAAKHPEKDLNALYVDLVDEIDAEIITEQTGDDVIFSNIPYKCKWCNQLYANRQEAESHHQMVHSHLELEVEAIQNTMPAVKYACPACTHTSESYPAMLDHIRVHAKPFICTHCKQGFRFPGQVKHHSDRWHKGMPIEYTTDEQILKELTEIRGNLKVVLEDGTILTMTEFRKRKHLEDSPGYLLSKKRKIEICDAIVEIPSISAPFSLSPVVVKSEPTVKQTARKSTTYIPPTIQVPPKKCQVAKKSTCPILKTRLTQSPPNETSSTKSSDQTTEFSYYGKKPTNEDNSRIIVAMQFGGLPMKVNLNTLVHLTNKSFSPKLIIRDLKKEQAFSWS